MSLSTVLVLGCGDIGSAVAHLLFSAGHRVVVCDLPRSNHARRGMAFTDAFFDGESRLDGVTARYAADVPTITTHWSGRGALPVTDMLEEDLARAIAFDVAVDAIVRRHASPDDRRWLAPLAIGLGPGFAPGVNCHVAVETQWGARLGAVLHSGETAPLSGGPLPLDGIGRERFIAASISGCWRTTAVLGQRVERGDVVGYIDDTPVAVPVSGALRGLARDGVAAVVGRKLVEVDPRATPQVFGLGERPLALAQAVCRTILME